MQSALIHLSYTNVIVVIAIVAITLANCTLLQIPASLHLLVVLGAGSFLVYQLDHSLPYSPEDRTNHPERVQWIKNHRPFVIGSCTLAFGLALWALGHLPWSVRIVVLGVASVSLFYIAPLLPGKKRLKDVPYAKFFLVLGCWAFGSIFLPLLHANRSLAYGSLFLVGYRLCYLLPNLLIADWMDREGDKVEQISTLAGLLSESRLRSCCFWSLLGAAGFALGFCSLSGRPVLLVVDLAGLCGTAYVLTRPFGHKRGSVQIRLDAWACWPLLTVVGFIVRA